MPAARKDGRPRLGQRIEIQELDGTWCPVTCIAHHGRTFGVEWPDGWREPVPSSVPWRPATGAPAKGRA